MLVTSIFSFFHNVVKSPLSQGHENQGLFGKGLKVAETMVSILQHNPDLQQPSERRLENGRKGERHRDNFSDFLADFLEVNDL